MATSPARQPNWLTRLKNLPRRWWIAIFTVSLVVHVAGVGIVLVLLFGGTRGGDDAAESLIISAAADNQESIDLELPDPVDIEREAEAEMDLSEILEVPLETDFNQASTLQGCDPACRARRRFDFWRAANFRRLYSVFAANRH